jgi:hypothetical protein
MVQRGEESAHRARRQRKPLYEWNNENKCSLALGLFQRHLRDARSKNRRVADVGCRNDDP